MLVAAAQKLVNHNWRHNGRPFDPTTPMHPPVGRYSTVHYGMMIPGLPAPLNFLDLIVVIGQPAIDLWTNPHLVETTPRDTANVLIGSGITFPGQFRGYRIEQDITATDDGSVVKFGSDLELRHDYPNFHLSYANDAFAVELDIVATDKVAHFSKLPAGIYDHWSLLCQHTGTVTYDGQTHRLSGLNTYEYARGTAIALPMKFFTYQILNIDESTQVLMTEVLGPMGLPLQRSVYVRSLTDHGAVYERGFAFEVDELEAVPRTTPNDVSMHLAKRFRWSVQDDGGNDLIALEAVTNDDYVYGMAGGYVGSYTYTGQFRGSVIAGTGYVEYVGTR
ncbi:DUF6670 family protein [Antrihabitans stalagmiti]|uniref:DUF6670 family protein n=1 Tax=Antrihabitans stalagmiti TaxID=2799499 RepID=UPI001F317AED|nr:DUF6670 family protein [Antrihabitans stalagmiti]